MPKGKRFLVDTFFEDSHLPLKKVAYLFFLFHFNVFMCACCLGLLLAYFWSRRNTSEAELMFQLQESEASTILSSKTICDWKCYFREICQQDFVKHRTVLGGPGKIVEIDETVSVGRKYNKGRLLAPKCILGGVERGTDKAFMYWVENRDSETLLGIIQQFVLPGTTIISDGWPAYKKISKLPEGYENLAVNYSEHFVNTITGAHTNSIESVWQKLKSRNKKEYGTATSEFGSYIEQHLWFQMFSGCDCFYHLMPQIVEMYPCEK